MFNNQAGRKYAINLLLSECLFIVIIHHHKPERLLIIFFLNWPRCYALVKYHTVHERDKPKRKMGMLPDKELQ